MKVRFVVLAVTFGHEGGQTAMVMKTGAFLHQRD
jgi:hypothetical protein